MSEKSSNGRVETGPTPIANGQLPAATYCSLSSEETAARLHTSLTVGLESSQDVNYRKSVHGPNELTGQEQDSLGIRFLQQFYENPLILLLIGSAAISFIMGNIDDAVSITVAIFIVVTVGFVQEYRSEQSLEALNKLVPPSCHLTRGNHSSTVLASNLVPGDLVHFSVGDRIPADVRITEAAGLSIDESNLTGEPHPVHKDIQEVKTESPLGTIPVSDRTCIAFMGTLVCAGNGSGIVVGTGHNTEFGSVFEMMAEIDKPKTPLQISMDKLGKELSLMSFGVIGMICLIGVIQGRSWLDMFQIGVSLAVAAIPEGLPIIVTVTLALGVLRMAEEKAIMRRLPSVETLGSVNVICSDKTGTLTKNRMTVTKLWTVGMGSTSKSWLTIDSHSTVNELTHHVTDNPALPVMLQVGNFCNNTRTSEETGKHIGNPTDVALIDVLDKFGLEDARNTRTRVSETPFSSSRKWMAVSAHSGDATNSTVYVKGAVERILPLCKKYVDAKGKPNGTIDEKSSKAINDVATTMALEGVRILAFAYSLKPSQDTENLQDLVFAGLIGMYDPPRPGVNNSINRLMQGSVKVIMITGDSEATASTIAKQIGMPLNGERSVMTGETLERLSTKELAEAISYVTVFARTSPENKLNIVRALQARGDVVAMTGDGVNDAPALKLADIGISMGESGTDVAKEAADMVLVDDDFNTILNAIKEGKAIFSNIQNFLAFQLSTSVAALTLVVLSTLFKLPNPLNAMQILWINILMDGPPAQSLGVEPVDPVVMTKPPRSRNDHVLTRSLVQRVFQSGLLIVFGTLFVYVREMSDNVVTARDTTMSFTCFVFFDMFNALSCRSTTKSVLEIGLFSNKMFNFAVGFSLLGQMAVIYVPFFQAIFQTEALYLSDLILLIALSSSVLIVDEIRKHYVRKNEWMSRYSNAV
ncbi:Ca(2+)/Mn(2+)-transporting P-type ATPase PMR1 [Sugiyamaella lignohabitans]|uniref:Calcium-transporting ATPase n=1 Tax=Sugiyamaella lignohabitans TaxID=796027 RepID=A0A161HLT7_9ASCO|nr:Ca(2+)/Mn(2+)-transporting P-type ATPase PMR1 [Sugiyamaella lignohabitans]ANB14427.1 Ca(2+)/Mn(2+)-transporting P-type ATPase PMR1 [Sugiyamaella lignohabitans]